MSQQFKQGRALLLLAALACAGWSGAGAAAGGRQEPATSRPRRAGEVSTAPQPSPQQQPPPAQQPPQQQPPRPKASPTPDENTTVDDDDVVRFETDLTNVLFTAVDRNKRFVTTIKKEDVRVTEDGVEQEVFTFQRETDRPLSLAILVDTSASQERTLPEEKSAAQQFVDAVIRTRKDEVAVLSFTGDATLEQGLTGNASNIRRAIDRIEFVPPAGYIGGGRVINVPGTTPPISGDSRAGSTAIWDAVWVTARDVLSETSDKTRRAIILLTDGVDTSSRLKMSEAIDAALKSDAIIYSIDIGDDFYSGVEEASLRQLSERTGGRAYFPRDETDLRAAFRQIQEELRSQYLLAYSPKNKSKDGTFRKVQIDVVSPELREQKLRLTYRQGYFAQSADPPARKKRG